jgi:translation initiation factor 3 subunit E
MVARRSEVVARLRTLDEAAAPIVAFLSNQQLVQELRLDKQYNIHMLQERYQVRMGCAACRVCSIAGIEI